METPIAKLARLFIESKTKCPNCGSQRAPGDTYCSLDCANEWMDATAI